MTIIRILRILLLGFGAFVAFFIVMFQFSDWQQNIEQDLTERSIKALEKQQITWAKVDFKQRGRDMRLFGQAPSIEEKQKAIEIAKKVYGVRIVEDSIILAPLKKKRPLEIKPQINNKMHAINLELRRCQNRFNIALRHRNIQFFGQQIAPQSEPILRQLLSAVLSCPDINVDIIGYSHSARTPLENKRLSGIYSLAVAYYLVNHGVPAKRLVAVSAGDSEPQVKDHLKHQYQHTLIDFLAIQPK